MARSICSLFSYEMPICYKGEKGKFELTTFDQLVDAGLMHLRCEESFVGVFVCVT